MVVAGVALGCAPAGSEPARTLGEVHEIAPEQAAKPGTTLNAFVDGGGMVYRTTTGGCVAHPPDGEVRAPGQMPPAVPLPCPPSMSDPAWDACAGSSLSTTADPAVCSCFVGGNPPPPARDVPCPPRGGAVGG